MDNNEQVSSDRPKKFNRRQVLAGLATLPVIGAVGYGLLKKQSHYKALNKNLLGDIHVDFPGVPQMVQGEKLRLGILGFGGRGSYLMKALGFVHPTSIDEYIENAELDPWWKEYYENFLEQEDLNVEVTALCDIFDVHATDSLSYWPC